MSITPEEQRALAIECGADEYKSVSGRATHYRFEDFQLIAYTAAVEAKERERVSLTVKNILDTSPVENMLLPNGEYIHVYSVIESQFRSLK
jgi:hypothetical protein